MKSPFRHRQTDYLLKILPLNVTVAAKRRPQMAGLGEQRCIENLEVGRLFFPRAGVSVCNFIQLPNVYLSHSVNTDVERRRRGEK